MYRWEEDRWTERQVERQAGTQTSRKDICYFDFTSFYGASEIFISCDYVTLRRGMG